MKKLILLLVLVLFSTSNIYAQNETDDKDESFEFITADEFNKLLPDKLKWKLKPGEIFLCDFDKIVKLSKEDVDKYVTFTKTYTKYKFKNKNETSIKYGVAYQGDKNIFYTVGETLNISYYNNVKYVTKNQYDYFGQEVGPEIEYYENRNSGKVIKEKHTGIRCNNY